MKKVNLINAIFGIALIVIILLFVLLNFYSCNKEGKEKTETSCPVVTANLVPQVVKDSFAVRYPAITVITWFNKDSVAFCAYFMTMANTESLAQFANNGSFIKEEIEINQEGNHQDSTGSSGKVAIGCECEIHNKGD